MKNEVYIYGRHAVIAVLENNPRAVKQLLLEKGTQLSTKAEKNASDNHIRRGGLNLPAIAKHVPPESTHQGMAAIVDPSKLTQTYDHFMRNLEIKPNTALIVLGEIQDPQNVGSIIRSAAAFGFAGVLIPEHNQSPVNATVVKVSAGMAFTIPLVRMGNVNTTLEGLKKEGFWIYGLAGDDGTDIRKEAFDAPTVMVVGNEGDGIRPKTREVCDVLLSIPMDARCESLNAGISAAVAMYQWGSKR